MSAPSIPASRARTFLFVAIVIVTNVAGNLALSIGMKQSEGTVLGVLLDPYVAGGILLLIGWTVSRMALLSWADLSYVLPVTALGYVLNALVGRYVLLEQVSAERWAGAVLVTVGAMLAGSTAPSRT